MEIELAVDALGLAEHVDQIVLFSGDGDFRSLVEALQHHGVSVTVVSTMSSQPPMVADELRRQADVFTDLVELQSKISRPLSHSANFLHSEKLGVTTRSKLVVLLVSTALIASEYGVDCF